MLSTKSNGKHTLEYFTYRFLPKREVKIAEYNGQIFFCMLIDGDGVKVHEDAKQNRTTEGQYPAILIKQAWLIEDLLCYEKRLLSLLFCVTLQVTPSGH